MNLFSEDLDPMMLKTIDAIQQQLEMNVDEYTKGERRPTDIQKFFVGKSIFLTGATGFMGKCLVEKLLRDCPELEKLYLLIRPRKDGTVEEKTKKYFSNIVFARLRKINPNFEDKVVAMKGDLQEEKLGLSAQDRRLLIDNVDIMVHNGATVKFNDPVHVSLKINVLGTRDMLDLAMACKHLQVFFYVSTAYSHCYMKRIQEKFYEPPADMKIVQDMIAADEAAKFGMSEEDRNMFLGKWTNIYTFSKSMAEDLVRQYGEKSKFACVVYRPSVVVPAYKEPLIGWSENKNGPTVAFIGIGLGAVHCAYYGNNNFDMIPVDYSINALIAGIYDAARNWETDKRLKVYNLGSSMANPTNFESFYRILHKVAGTLGSNKSIWCISLMFFTNMWVFYIMHFLLHFLPALLGDIACIVTMRRPRFVSLFINASKNLNWIIYFSSTDWLIEASEMRKVFDNISDDDKKLFDFNIWNMDWKKFYCRHIAGTRVHILKEPLDNLTKARKRYSLLRYLHYAFLTIFYLSLAYFAMKLFSIIS